MVKPKNKRPPPPIPIKDWAPGNFDSPKSSIENSEETSQNNSEEAEG